MNGYVTICNDAYRGLLEILIDGLDCFSCYPLEVFWTDLTPPPKHNRIVVRNIRNERQDHSAITMAKLDAILSTSFENGVFLDADVIPNRNIDELMHLAISNPRPYPLCPRHLNGPSRPKFFESMFKQLGLIEQTQPYVYANYLFSKDCIPFFMQCIEIRNRHPEWIVFEDESLMNCVLWLNGVKEQVNFFLPHPEDFFELYKNNLVTETPEKLEAYIEPSVFMSFHLFHGWKDLQKSQVALDWLKSHSIPEDGIRNRGMTLILS
jgi:hypothetical protein